MKVFSNMMNSENISIMIINWAYVRNMVPGFGTNCFFIKPDLDISATRAIVICAI